MRYAKLFPPCVEDSAAETCTIGASTFNVADVRFAPLPKLEAIPAAVWVDGGSAVLFKTPARAIGIIKVCKVETEGLKRTSIATHTYLVSVTANGTSFLVRSEPLANPDEAITACLQRDIPKADLPEEATPESLIDICRTLAEHCVTGGLVIHDGSLRTASAYLQEQIKEGVHAIAKTSGILTSRSRPVGVALLMCAPAGAWTAELSPGVALMRLHHAASHVFLAEGATPELLCLLHAWSADMAFPGYPYPLLLADQMARVTNNERDAWRVILASDEQAMAVIRGELKASDCHDVLEHILYGKQMF